MPIYVLLLTGIASWYSLPGNTMANGQAFIPTAHVCAMRYEPFGERIELVNQDNGNDSWCIVSDRGPFVPGRVIDVSPAVRDDLGFDGLANVAVYREIGVVKNCRHRPEPLSCKSPPPAPCVLNLPKPALLTCK